MADEIRGPLAQLLVGLALHDSKARPSSQEAGGEDMATDQERVAEYLEKMVRASAQHEKVRGEPFVILPQA